MRDASNTIEIVKRSIPGPKRTGRKGVWMDALERIRPGTSDSFDVPYGKLPAVYAAARRMGAKLVTRRLDLHTIGVWRKKE